MPESVYIRWEIEGDYAEIGGRAALQNAVEDACDHIPREHLRQLNAIIVQDRDPKGRALGVWRQDSRGMSIELYAEPHAEQAVRVPVPVRCFVLRLYLAHTLFHEVGHHVTLHLNRRAAPRRKRNQVEQTWEKWAELYVAKRMQGLVDSWQTTSGLAAEPSERKNLRAALQILQLAGQLTLGETDRPSASATENQQFPSTAS